MKHENYPIIFKSSVYYFAVIFSTIIGCDKENSCDNCPPTEDPIDFKHIDYEPAWSSDGEWIAFYHSDSVNSGIYLISPDGENLREWHSGIPETPSWSPDSKWIAFSEGNQIWKKKIDGDSLTQLTFEGRNFFPSWSPDGNWIAFDGWIPDVMKVYGIFKMDINGDAKILFGYSANVGAMRMPYWENDSTIVHIRYSQQFSSTSEIFSMDTSGGNELRLTFNNTTDYYPKFSNNKIAFTSMSDIVFETGIWIMNDDGSNQKRLTDTQAYGCSWSPDGKYIVYTDARNTNGRLWIMDEDGSNKRQLTFKHHFQ